MELNRELTGTNGVSLGPLRIPAHAPPADPTCRSTQARRLSL